LKSQMLIHAQNFYVEANNNKKVVMLDKKKYSMNQLIHVGFNSCKK